MANSTLTVTGLSFDQIRTNLRNFLAAKATFKDIDFADSAVGTLLDLLAYNTYLLSFYVNMATNEGFLDTAQLYDSVVSRAKALGYTPISARGASANLKITFATTANSTVRALQIAKHTQFTTSVNGASYIFVTPKSYTIPANSTNKFAGFITITEGTPLTHQWTYSNANTFFTIPNANTDISSVGVTVTDAGVPTTYTLATDIFTVAANSKIFFITADTGNRYRVSFGDGVLGAQPTIGSTVAVSYRVCAAAKPNGANTFSGAASIAGQTTYTLETIDRASGGSEQEPIESVRYNAPLTFETQNRAVTAEDYRRIILRDNPDLAAVNVWGGEENDPPIYGKVYVAVKPNSGTTIGASRKETLKGMLKRYNVQSINPELVDATFLYLQPAVTVNYDPTRTSGTAADIAAAVATAVANYEATSLNRFDGKFRSSKFLEAVDQAASAIEGSTLALKISKRFVADTTNAASYTFMFNHPFNWPYAGHLYALSSTPFTYKQNAQARFDDNGFGIVRIYYANADGSRTYLNNRIGTVNYLTGKVELFNFSPTAYAGAEITLTAEPAVNQYNIIPVRNQIILLREATVSVINDDSGIREINNWAITTIGTSATVLAPSYSSTVVY